MNSITRNKRMPDKKTTRDILAEELKGDLNGVQPLANATTAHLSLEIGNSFTSRTLTTVHALISQARHNPGATALRGPKSVIDGTYRELSYADLIQNAHTLMTRMIIDMTSGRIDGLKGKAILILLPRDVDFVVAMLACFFCGATYVPLSDTLSPARIAYIFQDSKAAGMITCSDPSVNNALSQAEQVLRCWDEDTCPPPTMMLEWVDNLIWSSAPHQQNGFIISKEFHKQLILPEPNDVAYMIYTSGTTGNPKGVEIEHHSMLNVLLSHVVKGAVTVKDMKRSVCVAAFIFDSHVREVWMPLVWGGCTCIAKDVLHMTEGSMCAGTPTGLIAANSSGAFPSTIETVIAGGEQLTGTVVQGLVQNGVKKIINAYGPTETVIECLVWKQEEIIGSKTPLPEAGMPIGLPISNVCAYGIRIADSGLERDPLAFEQLLDPKSCTNALAERVSLCELYIGGEGVARGYRNNDDLTSQKFLSDPFSLNGGRMYQTGDLVIFGRNPGDPIQYVGRIDTQVKIRGKRLELGEIKNFVCSSDLVKNAEVLLKIYQLKSQLVAYIVWNDQESNTSEQRDLEEKMMKRFETLEDYKRPATIISFPLTIDGTEYHDFPITTGGKVDLRKLPDPISEVVKCCEDIDDDHISAEPSSCDSDSEFLCDEIEIAIVKAVKSILQLETFSANDDFFKAGLTSMEVPSLKFFLKQDLNLQQELSTECIFENSTAQDLATVIAYPQNSYSIPTLDDEDFIESKYVDDMPLPGILVWLLSTFTAIFALATSLCFVFFILLICIEILHEAGKCSMPVGKDLQNNCDAPNKWRAYFAVAIGLPVVLPLCVCLGLVAVALMKRIVIGRYKPGYYSVDGLYYFRWLYVHHLEVFTIRWLLTTLPLRCTFIFNCWLRMMGAQIGSNVVVDSLDIHDMCLLTIGSDVTVQNDAMITGHTFTKIRSNSNTDLEGRCTNSVSGSNRKALVLGKCWVKNGATLGPYSMVHPPLPRRNERKSPGTCTVVEGILPGYQSTSRLGQSIQLDSEIERSHESLVRTPALTLWTQFEGIMTLILLQCVAFDLVLATMYHFFVPKEATFFTWIGRCYLFFSPWPMGIPYAFFVIAYKWYFIGRFKAGDSSSPRLDKYRWILRSLCQSRIQVAFELGGASSEILNTFYRLMGMKIGRNAQVMPLNIVEYDLFTIGDNCSFGGQVMVCCRNSDGRHEPCSIGNFSAITNSAGMLAGSKIGDNCLAGNLTLLPPNFSVPNDSKCVGTKFCDGSFIRPVTFSNTRETKPTTSKMKSELIVLSHILGSLFIDVVYYAEFIAIGLLFTACQRVNTGKVGQMHLVHNSWKVHGGYLLILATVIMATIISTLTIITIKRSIPKFRGQHERDSFLFVMFIWLTKHQMNMESWSYVFNGTPIQSFFYRLLGAEVSLSSRLFMRYFVDVDGLVVGEKAILAYDCYLEQHKKTAVKLEFDPLSILKNAIIGQRSIVLKNVCIANQAQLYPLSAVPPKETTTVGEIRGGILAEPYHVRDHEDAIAASVHSLNTSLRSEKAETRNRNGTNLVSAKKGISLKPIYENDVNMVVIGAGVSGIVAAHEFQQKNISVKVLEKSSDIMGCWQTFANQTSHVAVTEATYRLSGTIEDRHATDYPSRSQVLSHGEEFFKKHRLGDVTIFEAEVIKIKDVPGSSKRSFKKKHGHCVVTYRKGGQLYKIRCKGVFIATGAQAIRNELLFPGEEHFRGSIAYGSNDMGDPSNFFRGKAVCIVGGGAFAIENLKTALTHGAKHVTLVHRNDIQVWPRCVHYLLSSEENRKFSEYNDLYLNVARWAGLSVGNGPSFDIAPFMHPGTSAQPTANDSFFAFYKAGLVSLVHGSVRHVHDASVSVEQRLEKAGGNLLRSKCSEIPCDVFLKCIGWKDPGSIVRTIFPQFKSRNFVFLNESPRVVYVCDPRYRHSNQIDSGRYLDVLDTVPVGGTYSVPILSRIAATLQLYSLGAPLHSFDTMLESIPPSNQPLCSWIEAKFQYPKAKEISEVIRSVIDCHKRLVTQKHPTIREFTAMTGKLLMTDLEQRVASCRNHHDARMDRNEHDVVSDILPTNSSEDIFRYASEFAEAVLSHSMDT